MLTKDEILLVLREQNIWFKEFKINYLPREQYLKPELIKSKSILVIKGPRRAGKTVLLHLITDYLLKNNMSKEQILYLNMEDYRLFKETTPEFLEKTLSVYRENINPDGFAYFLIDEIQNIEGFERFIRTKYDAQENIKFIITGSNAKLLSKELGTLLTGRISSIEVFPFSFEEYIKYNGLEFEDKKYFSLEPHKAKLKNLFESYIENGGIPEFLGEENIKMRHIEYFENIIYKDIVSRFKIRNAGVIKELALILATETSKIFSINKLAKTLNVSVNTLQAYLYDLELSYLFFYLNRFSYSIKNKTRAQSKVYSIDTGLINSVGFKFSGDRGRLLENLVFIELKRCKKEIYYHKKTKECDFIIKTNLNVTEAIQVAQNLENKKTRDREINGLVEALKECNLDTGTIITDDEYKNTTAENRNIKIRPAWFWLLNKEE